MEVYQKIDFGLLTQRFLGDAYKVVADDSWGTPRWNIFSNEIGFFKRLLNRLCVKPVAIMRKIDNTATIDIYDQAHESRLTEWAKWFANNNSEMRIFVYLR
jgi:hypothetical protein